MPQQRKSRNLFIMRGLCQAAHSSIYRIQNSVGVGTGAISPDYLATREQPVQPGLTAPLSSLAKIVSLMNIMSSNIKNQGSRFGVGGKLFPCILVSAEGGI